MDAPSRKALAALLPALCVAAAPRAQLAQTQREYPKHVFRIRLPAAFKEAPVEPHERQILVKFAATFDANETGKAGAYELTALVVRIQKQTAITGGPKDKADEEQRAKSFAEQKEAELNSGKTLDEFLERHGLPSKLKPKDAAKSVKTAAGQALEVREVVERAGPVLRAYLLEDAAETFGLVVVGPGLEQFKDTMLASAKSLERKVSDSGARAEAKSASADPYEGSALRGLEHRRTVRAKLVKGWQAFDTDNFILITNLADRKLIGDLQADLEIMRAAYAEHFPPIAEITAVSTVRVCASYEEYMRYGAPDGTGGYWNPIDEELVLFDPSKSNPKLRPWLAKLKPASVLYHEAMHQYLHYANGHVAPASWFDEGYGEYFGGALPDRTKKAIGSIKKNDFRMEWVKAMQKQKAWPVLRPMLEMTQAQFYGESALQNYAMSWAFCWFLEQERQRKDGNAKWAAIPREYVANLRVAADEVRKKMPPDAPKDWMLAYREQIQKKAFDATFKEIDTDALEKAWRVAMAKY